MTDLTKASEALLARFRRIGTPESIVREIADELLAIEAAVRSDTLADVAARLPEALDSLPYRDAEMWANDDMPTADFAAAILAHLGGPR